MDTSEQFIRMCDCPEIQDRRPYTTNKMGDWWWWPEEHNTVIWNESPSFYSLRKQGRVKWLPRQDQLQEMCYKKDWLRGPVLFLQMFHPWVRNNADEDDTYEQLLLRFLMQQLHNKRWTGEAWE